MKTMRVPPIPIAWRDSRPGGGMSEGPAAGLNLVGDDALKRFRDESSQRYLQPFLAS